MFAGVVRWGPQTTCEEINTERRLQSRVRQRRRKQSSKQGTPAQCCFNVSLPSSKWANIETTPDQRLAYSGGEIMYCNVWVVFHGDRELAGVMLCRNIQILLIKYGRISYRKNVYIYWKYWICNMTLFLSYYYKPVQFRTLFMKYSRISYWKRKKQLIIKMGTF